MRTVRIALIVALTALVTCAPLSPATAAAGYTLKLTIEGDASGEPTVRPGSVRKFWGRMKDPEGDTRCPNAKDKNNDLFITSDAFAQSPDEETTPRRPLSKVVFTEHYTILPEFGKIKVIASCRGVDFTGYVHVVRPRALAHTGLPVLPATGVGLALIAVGWLLLLGTGSGLVILQGGQDRYGGRAAGSGSAPTRRH
jgi:hypothetical protein